MKDVMLFLEQNCAKSMKRLLLIYAMACLLFWISFLYIDVNQVIYRLVLLLGLPVIAFENYHHMNDLVKDGALTRLRLLPVKRYAFCLSEILFCSASYAGLFVCLYLTWYAFAWIHLGVIQGNAFLFTTWSYAGMDFLFPLETLHMLILVVYLITLGVNTIAGSLSKALKHKDISAWTSIYLSCWFIFQMTKVSLGWALMVNGIMLLVILLSLFYINRYLKLKRKKVKT